MKIFVVCGKIFATIGRDSPVDAELLTIIDTNLDSLGLEPEQFCQPKYEQCSNLRSGFSFT